MPQTPRRFRRRPMPRRALFVRIPENIDAAVRVLAEVYASSVASVIESLLVHGVRSVWATLSDRDQRTVERALDGARIPFDSWLFEGRGRARDLFDAIPEEMDFAPRGGRDITRGWLRVRSRSRGGRHASRGPGRGGRRPRGNRRGLRGRGR